MAVLSPPGGGSQEWSQLVLSHNDGREIVAIERNPVDGGRARLNQAHGLLTGWNTGEIDLC
jgi:hypothetical protein